MSVSEYGSKVQHARTWGLPLVTHLWLEALILEWRFIPPSTHSSYLLPLASSFGASSTNFAAILGDTAYTRDSIAKWAERDEVQQMRKEALRPVEELERLEREEEERRRAKLAQRAEAIAQEEGEDESDDEQSVVEAEGAADGAADEVDDAARNLPTPPDQPRKPPVSTTAPPKPPRQLSTAVGDTLDGRAEPVAGPSKERSKTPHDPRAAPAKVRPTVKDDLMDVDGEAEAMVTPARPAKPVKKTAAKDSTAASKPINGANGKKRQRSSSLSSASSSTSDEDDLPQPAKAMRKTFAQISDENLILGGTKRGAAAKARQALAVAIEDRNAFEKELKSSGRKKKYGEALGGASRRRSRSPTKKATHDGDGSDDEEEDEPESSAPKTKVKAKRPSKEEEEEDEIERPKKKPKSAADVVKAGAKSAVKALQASAGATNTQDGVVSSFDRPPHGKPPQP